LCDLAGLPAPDFVDGVSLRPLLKDPSSPGHAAVAYNSTQARSVRTETHRLILHNKDGYAELYDHTSPAKETENIAEDHPGLVEKLSLIIRERLER
jgi:iduronate 2-sulfatase